ncbi:hypothetical protein WR25_03362 isoform B [Diploscapter pachys]|uniref:Caspase family p20 domain-containing protein n=1 Tax=Diploscapter pachys TaxID=2018661 RepID=A0A2A2LKZ0_9BILA|nr:hypothetical protein WR25_03362 isoform B [Diploscapter pachys]
MAEELPSGNNTNLQVHGRVANNEIDCLKRYFSKVGCIFQAMGDKVSLRNSDARMHEIADSEIDSLKRYILDIGHIFQEMGKEVFLTNNEEVVDSEIDRLKQHFLNIGYIFQKIGKEVSLRNNKDSQMHGVADSEIDNLKRYILDNKRQIDKLVEVAENERDLDWTIECLKLVVEYVPTLQESNIGLGIGVEEISNVLLTGADGQLVSNDQVFDPLSIFQTLIGEFEDWLRNHPDEEPIPYEVWNGAGAALIIGVSDYSESNPQMDSLQGVEIDVCNLGHFFTTQLKYKVGICKNQSAKKIRQAIKEWSGRTEFKEASIIFVVLAGHGDHETFIASDGDSIPIFDLVQCIDNLHCPSDNPRPKIVLNLCCRGELTQVGNKYKKPNKHHTNKLYYLMPEVNPDEDIQATEIVPALSDFLFIDSTSPFSAAIEHPKGNSYLNILLTVLSKNCHDTNILLMLEEINGKFKQFYRKLPKDTSGRIVQPFFSSSLDKSLYLCPGFGNAEFELGRRQFEEQSTKEAAKKKEKKAKKEAAMQHVEELQAHAKECNDRLLRLEQVIFSVYSY